MEELYSIKHVAQLFDVTNVTIKNWVNKYNLPYQTTSNGRYYFSKSNIESIKQMLKKKFRLE